MIYLDYAAATPVHKVVLDEMKRFYNIDFANSSSIHGAGERVKEAVERARVRVAKVLGCKALEVVFVPSGTMSINLALRGCTKRGDHIITSTIEHKAVLNTCKYLQSQGRRVSLVGVNSKGLVRVKDVESTVNSKTRLVSIMLVNNEIGTVQDCVKIGKLISRINKGRVVSRRILFHIDACQAPNYLKVDVEELGCDLLTLNGSKIYGPKGSGVLFVREGVKIEPILYGGEQESGLVAGTQNVSAIVGFSKALEIAQKNCVKEGIRISKLRDYFIDELLKIKGTVLNGDSKKRVANNVNVSFVGLEAQQIVLYLSQYGIMTSAGSACTSNKIGISHVIEALGFGESRGFGAVRFTLGAKTSKKDLVECVKKIKVIVKSLRSAF